MEFDPNVRLETERLILRYMKKEDTHDIFININSDKEVLKYFIDKYLEDEKQMTLDKTIKYCLDEKRYLFAIELKSTHKVIGMMLMCTSPNKVWNNIEVGYAIGKRHWNNGYVTEAFKEMIKFLFSLGIHKVTASYLMGNDASKRVMEKCGLIYEGRKVKDLYYHDIYHDVEYYYILNPNEK